MKKEIVNFYAEKGLHISKMINRRPSDISPEQIEAAAELVYKDIQDGRELKNIQIASEVFRIAKDINGEKYAQEKALFEDSKIIIRDLTRKNKRLKICLIITLSTLLTMEIIWLWPYIMILFRGF